MLGDVGDDDLPPCIVCVIVCYCMYLLSFVYVALVLSSCFVVDNLSYLVCAVGPLAGWLYSSPSRTSWKS